MKSLRKIIINCKSIIAFLLMFFVKTVAWGQDKGTDVNIKITKDDSNWYAQPWVWIIGGAVFILLLVALLRGGNKKD